jgi:hypothetical protein
VTEGSWCAYVRSCRSDMGQRKGPPGYAARLYRLILGGRSGGPGEFLELVGAQVDRRRGDVLLEVLDRRSAGNRQHAG